MKVGVVDSKCRIRDLKVMFALRNDVDFVFMGTTKNKVNLDLLPKVKFSHVSGPKDIMRVCNREGIDILHTHNFPDTYGEWAMRIREKLGLPFVHEVHDMAYENTPISAKKLEKKVFKNADALISVGINMQNLIKKKHGAKSFVIYAYPNKEFLPIIKPWSGQCKNGIYQGGIRNIEVKKSKFNHRFYKDIFKKLSNQGISIDVFPAYPMNGVGFNPYIKDIRILYEKISHYDFAFVGYNPTSSGVMDIAAPNKLFEAIGSGIPIIAMDYNEISWFIKQNNIGVVIDKKTLRIPKDINKKMRKAKENVAKNRFQFTMEKQRKKIINIYRSIL